jgi:hypothetical protein
MSAGWTEVEKKQDFRPLKAEKHESAGDRRPYIFYNFQRHPTVTVPSSTFAGLDIEDIYANT